MACSACVVSLKTARSSDVSAPAADVHTTLLAAGCSGSGNVPCRTPCITHDYQLSQMDPRDAV